MFQQYETPSALAEGYRTTDNPRIPAKQPNPMLHSALEYAENGWPVFPLRGKVPALSKADGGNGHHDATTDLEIVKLMWRRFPEANIGIAIPNDIVALDVDTQHGQRPLHVAIGLLTTALGLHRMPPTLTCLTGSGGLHYYFHNPFVGSNLEWQRKHTWGEVCHGPAHYLVAPSSIHPDTGTPYQWLDPNQTIGSLPRDAARKLLKPQQPRVVTRAPGAKLTRAPGANRSKTAEMKLKQLFDDAARLTKGERDNGLFTLLNKAHGYGATEVELQAMADAVAKDSSFTSVKANSMVADTVKHWQVA